MSYGGIPDFLSDVRSGKQGFEPERTPIEVNIPDPVYVRELSLVAKVEMDWIWHGYLARGCTTLLTSLWKTGKTTLLAHLLVGLARRDGEFCGQALTPTRTLVVSEERVGHWALRCERIQLQQDVWFLCQPLPLHPDFLAWMKLLHKVEAHVKEFKIGLVVIDPLANYIPGDENVAGAVLSFLQPLTRLTKANVGVLLLHHPRKGGGDQGRSARGSGALAGFVDIQVEMHRPDGDSRSRARLLRTYTRFDEMPDLVVELNEGDAGYRVVGSRGDLAAETMLQRIAGVLSTSEARTVDEILSQWPEGEKPPSKPALQRWLLKGTDRKLWERRGMNEHGSPYRYFKKAEPSPAPASVSTVSTPGSEA